MMITRGEEMVRGLGRLFVAVIAGIIHGAGLKVSNSALVVHPHNRVLEGVTEVINFSS